MRQPEACAIIVVILLLVSLSGVQAQERVARQVDARGGEGLVSLRVLNASSSIRPCEVATFAFELENPSEAMLTLDLGATSFEGGVFFSQNPVVLRPAEVRTISMFVVPPCEYYGLFPIEVIVQSRQDSSRMTALVGSLEVSADGIIEIGEGVNRIRVDYNRSGTFIPVRNIGGIDATYNMTVEGPSWVTVRPAMLVIPAGEKSQVQVITAPGKDLEKGTYRATVFARVRETGVEYGRSFQIVLAPYTAQELFWNKYKTALLAAGVGIVVLVVALVVVLVCLMRTKEARAKVRAERAAQKDLARQQKAAERIREEQEKKRKGKEKVAGQIKEWLKKVLRKEHVLFQRDGSRVRPWVTPLVGVLSVLILAAGAGLVVSRKWALVEPWWVQAKPLVLPFGAGIGVVIVVVILIKAAQAARLRSWRSVFSGAELAALKDLGKNEMEQDLVLVPISRMRQARKDRPTGAVILLLLASMALLGAAIAVWRFEQQVGSWWRIAAVSLMVLAGIVLLIMGWILQVWRARIQHTLLPVVSPREKALIKTSWRDGLKEVEIRSKVNASGVLVSIRRHAQCLSFVVPDEPVYQYVEVGVDGMSGRDLEEVTVRFRVAKKWLEKNRSTEKDVFLLRYDASRTRWVRCACSLIEVRDAWMFFVARDVGTGLFAITVKQSMPEPKQWLGRWLRTRLMPSRVRPSKEEEQPKEVAPPREAPKRFERLEAARVKRQELMEQEAVLGERSVRWIKYVAVLLIIGLIVGAVVYWVLPTVSLSALMKWWEPRLIKPVLPKENVTKQPVTKKVVEQPQAPPAEAKKGIPDQAWPQDTVKEVNLSRFFSDPDNEQLIFSSEAARGVSVEHNGSMARLVPDKGFVGEASTVFIATDKEGRQARSNTVRLVVQQGPAVAFQQKVWGFAQLYAGYLVAGLIVLAVMMVSVILLRKSKKKDEEEKED